MAEALLVAFGAITYFLRTIFFTIGAYRSRNHRQDIRQQVEQQLGGNPVVSVIVPARNEEKNIRACVESLFASQTHGISFEVIVVNDRSEDRTGDILVALQQEYLALRVIQTDVHAASSLNLKGKTRALDQGIRSAQGQYILMTDADCTVSPTWISSMVESFRETDASLVAAFSLMKPTSFFAALQAVEWTHNHTLASAGVAWKQPLGCFGNNLAIKRTVYEQLGGYTAIPFSVTEDLALLQAVHRTGQTITYRCSADSKIYTLPCETISEYIKQHHRWVNGARALGGRQHLFVFTIFALWVGIVGSIILENYVGAIFLLALRMVADSFLIISSLRVLKDYKLIYYTPICTLCMAVIELFLPFLLLKPSVTWKGQVFSGK